MNQEAPAPKRFAPVKAYLRKLLRSAASLFTLGGLYGWSDQEQALQISHVSMPLEGLDKSLCGTRIAQISDIHCGPTVSNKFLHQCVAEINSLDVEFVVITGDMVLTGKRKHSRRAARILAGLSPKVSTLACLGNHDYGIWHPGRQDEDHELANGICEDLADAGIRVLNNESHTYQSGKAAMRFVGVEDLWTTRHDVEAAFEDSDIQGPTVALCHNPDAAPALAEAGAHWVLAGHTHGRTVSQFGFKEKMFPATHKHLMAGEHCIGDGRYVYINTGLGFRRRRHGLVRPEVTVFTMCSES